MSVLLSCCSGNVIVESVFGSLWFLFIVILVFDLVLCNSQLISEGFGGRWLLCFSVIEFFVLFFVYLMNVVYSSG